jgi:hypothetical protein
MRSLSKSAINQPGFRPSGDRFAEIINSQAASSGDRLNGVLAVHLLAYRLSQRPNDK